MSTNYVRAYRDNPCIERLEDIRSQSEWRECLNVLLPISEEEREAPPHYRIHSCAELTRVFIARPEVVELAMHLDLMLRQGYVERNPRTKQRAELLNSLPATDDEMEKALVVGESLRIISCTLIGYTGVGKSVSSGKILKKYKQKIDHKELGITQIVWLKIEMPSDGGIKQLVLSFCYALEKALGEELPFKVSDSTSTNTLLIIMAKLSAIYSIGLLVVDEVQNLTVRRGNNRENMLNVLQTICNMVHVPLFMIGTMKAQTLFSQEARHARRATAYGSFVWSRLDEGKEWDLMLDTLWQYQWTKKDSALTVEMRQYLHDATQGLMALLPVMLMLAQHRAILTGKEEVSLEILKWVYKQRFQPVHAMLDALRTGNTLKLIQYEDLWLPDFLETVKKEQAYAENVAMTKIKPSNDLPPRRKAALDLARVGYDLRSIEIAIDKAVAKGKTTAAQIIKEARYILENVKPETTSDPDDLRYSQRDTKAAR